MRGIAKSVRGFGLAALVASAPAAAQVTLNASSWVPPGHPLTATMLVPLCGDIEKATAARVKCNILPKAPVGAVQTFDGVKDGLMDLSFVTHGYSPGRTSTGTSSCSPYSPTARDRCTTPSARSARSRTSTG